MKKIQFNFLLFLACNCDSHGSLGISCDTEGFCSCRGNFDLAQCNQCKEGFYNYPDCEGDYN